MPDPKRPPQTRPPTVRKLRMVDRARAGLTWTVPPRTRVRVDASTDWGVREHEDEGNEFYNRRPPK